MNAINGMAETAIMKTQAEKASALKMPEGGKYTSFEELKGAAKGLEKLFIGYMLKAMRKAIDKNELINAGRGEEVFQEYLDNEFADKAAGNAEFGIAKMVVESLKDTLPGDEQPKAENYVRGLVDLAAAKKAYEEAGDA